MILSHKIQLDESRTLEFKAERSKYSIKWIKIVLAFANDAGERIVVGVNNDRQIISKL